MKFSDLHGLVHMRSQIFSALLTMLVGASACRAQTFPLDVETYSDAIASMKAVSVTTETLSRECSNRLPELKRNVSDASTIWRARNKRAIGRADAYWEALSKSEGTGELSPFDTLKLKLHETVRKLAEATPVPGKATLTDYCLRYFDQLNHWRGRTPRLHQILDDEI